MRLLLLAALAVYSASCDVAEQKLDGKQLRADSTDSLAIQPDFGESTTRDTIAFDHRRRAVVDHYACYVKLLNDDQVVDTVSFGKSLLIGSASRGGALLFLSAYVQGSTNSHFEIVISTKGDSLLPIIALETADEFILRDGADDSLYIRFLTSQRRKLVLFDSATSLRGVITERARYVNMSDRDTAYQSRTRISMHPVYRVMFSEMIDAGCCRISINNDSSRALSTRLGERLPAIRLAEEIYVHDGSRWWGGGIGDIPIILGTMWPE